jgi:hypothetical protein
MMLRHLLAGVLALCFAVPAYAADQVPLKRNNGIPATFGSTDTVGVAHGGTGASSASGTAVDNISGFSGTGFLTRTGAGAYSFQSTTNGITLGNIAQIAANKVIGNATASTATASPLSMPSCSTASSALTWTTSSGFGCNSISVGTGTVTTTGSPASGNLTKFSGSTSVTSGDLSGDCTTSGTLAITCTKTSGTNFGTFATQNYATPPAIGGTTPAAGTFSTLSATGNLTTNVTGSTQCLQASSSGVVSGTGSACGAGGGGGAMTLVSTQTITGQTTVTFPVSAGYDYRIVGSNVGVTVSSGSLLIQCGYGVTPTWDTGSNYFWVTFGSQASSGNAVTSMSLVTALPSGRADSLVIESSGMFTSATNVLFTGAYTFSLHTLNGLYFSGNGPITGIRLLLSGSGNISGTFSLYSIAK